MQREGKREREINFGKQSNSEATHLLTEKRDSMHVNQRIFVCQTEALLKFRLVEIPRNSYNLGSNRHNFVCVLWINWTGNLKAIFNKYLKPIDEKRKWNECA